MVCPKCERGFIFHPKYGPERCSNALCDWNLKKNRSLWNSTTPTYTDYE